jgi:hypothetical protein
MCMRRRIAAYLTFQFRLNPENARSQYDARRTSSAHDLHPKSATATFPFSLTSPGNIATYSSLVISRGVSIKGAATQHLEAVVPKKTPGYHHQQPHIDDEGPSTSTVTALLVNSPFLLHHSAGRFSVLPSRALQSNMFVCFRAHLPHFSASFYPHSLLLLPSDQKT